MHKINRIISSSFGAAVVAGCLALAIPAANAQTAATQSTPVFYNQSGTAVNPGGTPEPAGNYYNQQGQQVYYYGNGTYYNSATGQYGGTAFTNSSMASPGVPTSMTTTAAGNGSGTVMTTSASNMTGITPVFYQGGTAMNPGGTSVPAGNYTLQNGDPVYYYGNGTYYDATTGQYGGQAFGTMALATGTASTIAAPALPNTGAGGTAEYTILAMLAALSVAAGGITYLARSSSK